MEIGVPNIYAAGDIAEFYDVTIGRHNILGTWGNSIGHGKTAAMNMLGQRTVYEDIPMYSSTLFDSYIRVIGMTPETGDDLESFEHLNAQAKSYQRLFFLDGRLRGRLPDRRHAVQTEAVRGDQEPGADPARRAAASCWPDTTEASFLIVSARVARGRRRVSKAVIPRRPYCFAAPRTMKIGRAPRLPLSPVGEAA